MIDEDETEDEGRDMTDEEIDAAVPDADSIPESTPEEKRKRAILRMLRKNDQGGPKATLANAMRLIDETDELRGAFRYDELADDIAIVRSLPNPAANEVFPRELLGEDISGLGAWFERTWEMNVGAETILSAVVDRAKKAWKFNPVTDYLNALKWDGESRLETWLHDYLGAQRSELAAIIGSKWLLSAVARAYKPGCQADHVLVLEGAQGIGKSSALRALFGEFHQQRMPDPKSKEAGYHLQGSWCVEASELDAYRRAEMTAVKSFITETVDKYRPPYGKVYVSRKRRCVFAGTTNETRWITDDTGGRRFWPVQCGSNVDVEALKRDRDQLWAEAVIMFRGGATWWPDADEQMALLGEAQDERTSKDPWAEVVRDWLGQPSLMARSEFTMSELLTDCLKIEIARQAKGDATRAGIAVAKTGGWENRRVMRGGVRSWVFQRK